MPTVRPLRPPRALLLLAGVLAAAAGCGREPAASLEAGAPRHVVLVVVDTLRADHVGAYGGAVSTPVFDGLAAQGAMFRHAYSHIPITGPSHATLFTGLLPLEHKVEGNAQIVAEELEWLPERLAARGFETAGFVSLGVLQEKWGFAQGFDHFDDDFPGQWFRPAAVIRERVTEWIREAGDEPSFLWVHLSDPHEPYSPPGLDYPEIEVVLDGEPIGTARADGYNWTIPLTLAPGDHEIVLRARGELDEPLIFRSIHETGGKAQLTLGEGWDAPPGSQPIWMNAGRLPATLRLHNAERRDLTPGLRFFCHEDLDIAEVRRRYALEVENADRELGRIVEALQQRGWWEDTLLVLTSDHGEGLGQHGLVGHIEQLYETLIHVPLIVVSPGRVTAGLVVGEPVRHLDVSATLFDYLGLEAPTGRGRSLRPLLSGASERRPVVSMTFPPTAAQRRHSLVLGRYKYIFTEDGGVEEFYDLRSDPEELSNLLARESDRVAQMRSRLALLMEPLAGAGAAAVQPAELSEEERSQLRALGYLR